MATHRILLANTKMAELQEQFETFEQIEAMLWYYDSLATLAVVTTVIQLLKNLDFVCSLSPYVLASPP